MECFPLISDSGGFPVLLFPLGFVVGLSMIKDIYEDYQRHQSDKEENNRKAIVATPHDTKDLDAIKEQNPQFFDFKQWNHIRVGSIVKVHENEYFPCDMIILNSSLPKGICYVETKNLDGETNLKYKQAAKECIPLAKNDQTVLKNYT